MRLTAVLIAILLAWSSAACERKRSESAAKTGPAPVSSNEAPTTSVADAPPPTTRPIAAAAAVVTDRSFMMIDQTRVEFPTAKLRVSETDGRVVALLYSDDPRDAIDDKYTGNSFYFEMPLDVSKASDFVASAWRFTSSKSAADRDDTPYGIFLEGRRRQLQPLDVKVEFESAGPDVTTIWMAGRFLLIDMNDAGQIQVPREVSLAAKLTARTAMK